MKQRRILSAFLTVATVVALFPTEAKAVYEYYSISRSVRALGMGNAFHALSDDDGALFYNPAGLALIRGGERFSVLNVQATVSPNVFDVVDVISNGSGKSTSQIAQDLEQFQGQAIYGGPQVGVLSMHRKNFAIAVIVPDVKINFGLLGAGVDTSVEATAIADAGVVAGFGTGVPGTNLKLGINGKGLVRAGGRRLFTLDDIAAGNSFTFEPGELGGAGFGIDFDLGAIYEFDLPARSPLVAARAALTLSNILASSFDLARISGNGLPPQLPRMLSLGGSFVFRGWGPFDNFNVLVDLAEFCIGGQSDPNLGARTGSFLKHVNIGVEAPMGLFSPRIGLHQGYWTAGFGLDLRVVKLAFATYAEELASAVGRFENRRYVARLELGWGGAPPPPLLGTERDNAKGSEPIPNGGEKPPEPAKPATDPGKTDPAKPVDPPAAPAPVTPPADPNSPAPGALTAPAVDANGVPKDPPQLEVDKMVPQTEGPNPNLPRGGSNVPVNSATVAPPAAPPATTTTPSKPSAQTTPRKAKTRKPASTRATTKSKQ